MCGIAGFQGRFDADLLARMTARIAHRGPDGAGAVVYPAIADLRTGLGHRRLSIIDLSPAGAQPMSVCCACCGSSGSGSLDLTYNGEIYNYRELRAGLVSRGHAFRSETDSEVLLHLYAEYGTDMLRHLNGIFAFAIRDGRERGRPDSVSRGDLFIARDALGVKPLYWTVTADGFLFASELKSILEEGSVARRVDLRALHQYLAFLMTPAPTTLMAGIRKLPPGGALIVRDGRVAREWEHYELPHTIDYLTGDRETIAHSLRDALAKAVERQLVADVPVGAFLSGGLDSSAIVALMRQAGATPSCFTIAFPDGNSVDGAAEDLPYARRVASHLGVPLREIPMGPDVIQRVDEMLWHVEEPLADPAPLNALLIAEAARADGLRVLMSGAGGDDVFSGYRRHRALAFDEVASRVPMPVRRRLARVAREMAAGKNAGGASSPMLRRLFKAFSHLDEEGDRRIVSYFFWGEPSLRRSLYSQALAQAAEGTDEAAPYLQSLASIPREPSALNRMLHLELRHFLADHNLNYTDKMAMAAGVEVRVPLIDQEIVEFAARIPPGYKQRGAVGKAIFKDAMLPLLPRDVVHRPKTGFGAPLRRWLHTDLRDRVQELLAPSVLRDRGLFDPAAVARLVQLDRAGRVDATYTIFALMGIEQWCRLFVDRSSAPLVLPEPAISAA